MEKRTELFEIFNDLDTPTNLVEGVDFHGEAIDSRHGRHGLQLRAVGGKVGLKGNVVEEVVAHIWLLTVLRWGERWKNNILNFKLNHLLLLAY